MLEYRVEDFVAYISIDDGKMNAFSHEMLEEVEKAFSEAEKSDEVKLVVFTGNNKAFSAGFDLNEIKKGPAEMKNLVTRGMKFGHTMFLYPKPVIILTRGHTVAMGAILLASDYCLAVDNEKAKIGLNETAIGITMPQIAVEFGRFRLPPKYFEQSFLKADIYSMKQACDVGYISQLAQARCRGKLSAVVETYKALDMRSYRNTKMRIRKQVVESVNLDEI